ncbi:STAS domain-containing protein [Kordiimonas laminariae]|uniref:STAS domain-containing protein n=1 Tax=Kordiimonas laminariae TaxID=2917717 RepID=UPI001FF53391|nr:STAS domain-containing protein [Kordiimonas laminariae]MCK0068892.1 STAS domain-containing protein [Kordiimonas laminariae]
MRFETKRDGDVVNMIVSGSLSFEDCREWRKLVEAVLKIDVAGYVLDLTALESIDSAGLGMMLNMRDWAEGKQKTVGIKLADESVSGNMIRLAKFEDWIIA